MTAPIRPGARPRPPPLCLQQPPLQQRPHVAPPVRDDEHVGRRSARPVDDAVRLEEDLAVLPDPDVEQLPRVAPAARVPGELRKASSIRSST